MRPSRLALTVSALVVAVDALTKLVLAHVLVTGRVVHAGPASSLIWSVAGADRP